MATHPKGDSDRSRGRSPMRWSPIGQQVMIPTPGQTNKRFVIGAVNYHRGETVVIVRKRKRREQIAELLHELLAKHPTQRIYVAWDNADTHSGGEIDAVLGGAAGRLVLLPTYSPWLNPIERGGPSHVVAPLATRSDAL